jgi:hypothetical protein
MGWRVELCFVPAHYLLYMFLITGTTFFEGLGFLFSIFKISL